MGLCTALLRKIKVAVTKNIVHYTNLSCLLSPSSLEGGHGGGGYKRVDDEALTMERPSAPSPQSEAVANDLQELSLQPGTNVQVAGYRPNDPPLSERKNVLQLKLQQRRTREELVNQGIMPPLKSPASFHEQRRSLERARTEDYLKRKIRCRPERSELVRMHILEETSAEPSLQAKQLKLKRARLADDLNEKISQRPGPMELVVKNILPVETNLKEVIIDVNYAKVADSSSFDEDSSDALSPDQPASQESQGSVPSPAESRASEATAVLSPTQTFTWVQLGSDQTEKSHTSDLSETTSMNISNGPSASANKSFSFIKHNQSKSFHDKSQRTKKIKEPKSKVKKLKYHQYIPPNQKQKGTSTMDSTYAKILQQQQLFLQLQILNQQQHQHYNYQTILPAPPKPKQDQQTAAITSTTTVRTLPTISISTHSVPNMFRPNSNMATVLTKIGPLPHNLDDMKVAELKQELKQRGLHVSGTKVDLIERLKATQDTCTVTSAQVKSAVSIQQPKPSEVVMPTFLNISASSSTVESSILSSFSSTPPCSPCPSEVSLASMDEVYTGGDSFSETVSSPVNQPTLMSSSAPLTSEKSEVINKDIMLREKDRQIEELTRRLKQKQDLVERLRQQLEKEKNTYPIPPCDDQQTMIVQVKQEPVSFTCDSIKSTQSLDKLAQLKSELITHTTCQQEQQTFTDSVLRRDETKSNGSTGAQLVFTVHSPSTGLPDDSQPVILQTMTTPAPLQISNLQPKTEVLQPSPQSSKPTLQMEPCTILSFAISSNIEPFMNVNVSQKQLPDSSKENLLSCSLEQVVSPKTLPSQPAPPKENRFLTPSSPTLIKATPENGETVGRQPSNSGDGQLTGQQMDDYFDVLLHNLDLATECKEFLVPCLKQTPTENAVPQHEMPPPLSAVPDQLEDFLETSVWTQLLQGEQDAASMPVIDDLHSQMLSSLAILDHPSSPMDTSDTHFSSPERDPLGLDMSEPPLNGMDWLELTGPPAMNLTPLSTATPSVFSTDFLDSHDMQLHWDSCL